MVPCCRFKLAFSPFCPADFHLPASSMAIPMKTAMKSMKKATPMKARARDLNGLLCCSVQVMKKKAVSKIARGKRAKVAVFKGTKEKTASGHGKTDLMKNKRGKIVTKASNAKGKKAFQYIEAWNTALMKARKELGINGFCAVNGKTTQGKALYAKAKAHFDA